MLHWTSAIINHMCALNNSQALFKSINQKEILVYCLTQNITKSYFHCDYSMSKQIVIIFLGTPASGYAVSSVSDEQHFDLGLASQLDKC